MKVSQDIQQRLRAMLVRFYSGLTNREEEYEDLASLFDDDDCRTEEFADDRTLFEAMSELARESDTAEAPPELGAELEAMVSSQFSAKRRRVPVWLRAVATIASAACLTALIVTLPLRGDGDAENTLALVTNPPVADDSVGSLLLPVEIPDSVACVVEDVEVDKAPGQLADAKLLPAAPRHKAASARAPRVATNQMASAHETEMSPEEASRISEEALLKIAGALTMADKTCKNVDRQIENSLSTAVAMLSNPL